MSSRVHSVKLLTLVAVMGALGNALGFLSIPLAPGVMLNLAHLPALLLAVALGAKVGAVTGFLTSFTSLYLVYFVSGYLTGLFIPIGGAILGGVTGLASRKFRPLISCIIGEIAEQPYMFLVCYTIFILVAKLLPHVAISITLTIMAKAWVDVIVSAIIVEILISRGLGKWIKDMILG